MLWRCGCELTQGLVRRAEPLRSVGRHLLAVMVGMRKYVNVAAGKPQVRWIRERLRYVFQQKDVKMLLTTRRQRHA